MYGIEIFVFVGSFLAAFIFFMRWYGTISATSALLQNLRPAKGVLRLLPFAAVAVTWFTLALWASYDVRGSFFYTLYYVLLGVAWQYFGLFLITVFFDLSWRDDILNLNNQAALVAFSGGFMGLNLIYNGANIGDGPGWWCVIFAGALGLVSWIALGILANRFTGVFERITVERDTGAGIRFGAYMLSSGLIFGRACGGDWTSFSSTVVEFLDGWPVLGLALIAILVEWHYRNKAREDEEQNEGGSHVMGSVCWGALYITFALLSITLLPAMSHNPLYR